MNEQPASNQPTHNLASFIERCLERWGVHEHLEERIQHFKSNFTSWLFSLPPEMRQAALSHFEQFVYYPQNVINENLGELYTLIKTHGYYDFDSSVFSYIQRPDGSSNSSSDLLYELKSINNIPRSIVIMDQNQFYDKQFKEVRTVIFIDDFCGSGRSFIKCALEKHIEALRGKRIVYAVICCMEKGRARILSKAKELQISTEVIAIDIKDAYYPPSPDGKSCDEVRLIKECSKSLGIKRGYELGYNKTQALVAFSENTPNNTFGYIWSNSPDNVYKPIFSRQERKKPSWQLSNEQKRSRNVENYSSKQSQGRQ